MAEPVAGVLGSILLLTGLILATIGLIGMLRHPDIFSQLHAAGLITGPGVVLVLLASLASGQAEVVTSSLLVVAFVLVTASLSTHAIALAAWRRREAAREGRSGTTSPGPDEPMRVLIAYDGSPEAESALRVAAVLPWPKGAVLRLFGVLDGDLPSHAASGDRALPGDLPRSGSVEAALDAGVQTLERSGVHVEGVVGRGEPASAIVEEAAVFAAGLVVMGTRGLGPLRAIVLGSVTSEVVDRAPCPVLVTRSAKSTHVLLAIDGSGASDAAIDAVATWPIFAGTRVRVVTVAAAEPHIADVVERLRGAGRRADAHWLDGDPAPRILDFAETESIDLIVLGSRGHTGLRRTLLGSVARAVLSSASTSVLIVRTQATTTREPE